MTDERREFSLEAAVVALELAASECPPLLDFLLETISNSPMRFAAFVLASDLSVPLDEVGPTIYRASLGLDKLEKRRGAWRDPGEILESPNIAALRHLCKARAGRVSGTTRRRWLGVILRRLQKAHELARFRARIEAFIGLSPQEAGLAGERSACTSRDLRRWIEKFLAMPGPPAGDWINRYVGPLSDQS